MKPKIAIVGSGNIGWALKQLLKDDFTLFEKKYEISNTGNFEGKNILVETKNKLSEEEQNKIKKIEEVLVQERNKRVKPIYKVAQIINQPLIHILITLIRKINFSLYPYPSLINFIRKRRNV